MIEASQQREAGGAEAAEGRKANLAIPEDPLTPTGVEHRLVDDGLHRHPQNGVGVEGSLR